MRRTACLRGRAPLLRARCATGSLRTQRRVAPMRGARREPATFSDRFIRSPLRNKYLLAPTSGLLVGSAAFMCTSTASAQETKKRAKFYDFAAKDIKGNDVSMSQFAGKVVIVVNVASEWGQTRPQYNQLEALYQKYAGKGLVVVAFPCNQFGRQEPGDPDAIQRFVEALQPPVTFPLFAKVDVNGANAHPLFTYLKEELPGWLGNNIKWNFTKFLIARDGTPFKRYATSTKPLQMEEDIVKLLNQK